jgi:peptidoglycan-associated lipoprotein
MKLNRLLQGIIVAMGVISLSSCASLHHKNGSGPDGSNTDVNGAAQTSGTGDGSSFGGDAEAMNRKVYYFDFDRSEIRDDDKPAINANADNLIAHRSNKILLEGHTDPRGSREYNVALGERRANAIADFMKAKGVSPDQIRVISYGAERLAVPGHTEQDFQQDRRVVLVYLQQ